MAINHVYLIDQDTENTAVCVRNKFFEQFELDQYYPTLTIRDVEFFNLTAQVCFNEKKNGQLC